ncbi:hypothetical protein DFP94_107163 [Fontibacillus phaseoli]|uniref:Cell-wall binding lipoprotein n=1 Tax=Fontibacillus phaseoli TaxID=1416533 RepID=A0A369BC82_9BACL|nr:hypothetical protein [Fontibacillus phaseoli]RCX18208.1 hypothetical protein DFP94_107163 [Fontibacillus phaseoli]
MKKQILMMLALAIWLAACLGGSTVMAAAIEFTDSLGSQLNKTADGAGGAMRTKILKQYADLSKLQDEHNSLVSKTSGLHYDNEARLTAARKEIKEIDGDKIRRLDEQVKSAKSKYQPLFDSYSSISKQASAAKKLKDKTLSKLLQTQADGLKTASTLARQDIRNKESALQAAKKEKTRKAKEIRKILGESDLHKSKIKAEKSAMASTNKLISTEWSNFKAAVKKSEADRTTDTLTRLHTLSSQALKNKQNIYNLEVKISASAKNAEDKLR